MRPEFKDSFEKTAFLGAAIKGGLKLGLKGMKSLGNFGKKMISKTDPTTGKSTISGGKVLSGGFGGAFAADTITTVNKKTNALRGVGPQMSSTMR